MLEHMHLHGTWGDWAQLATVYIKEGTVTTDTNGRFSSGISRSYDILSVTVMKTEGLNFTRGEVYTRNDQTNHAIYVYDASGVLVTEKEVSYRIRYMRK